MSEAFVKLDYACNQECLFCCTSDDTERLSEQEAITLIDRYLSMGYRTISFTGGEPTVRPDLVSLIAYAHKKGCMVKLQTNALKLADNAYARSLAQAGLGLALVSIHSHLPSIHDSITNVPGSLELSQRGIQNLIDNGIQTHLAYVITTENLDMHSFVIEMRTRFAIPFFLFFLAWPNARGWKNRNLCPTLSAVAPHLAQCLDYCNAHAIKAATRGIPLCAMPNHKEYSSERQGILSDEQPMVINDYATLEPKHSFMESNVKEDACRFCSLDKECGGVWRRYPQVHPHELWPVMP